MEGRSKSFSLAYCHKLVVTTPLRRQVWSWICVDYVTTTIPIWLKWQETTPLGSCYSLLACFLSSC